MAQDPGVSRSTRSKAAELLMRHRVETAEVGRLATITSGRMPHLVPCCFVLVEETVYSAVDGKAKSGRPLRRVENLRQDPAASLLVDHYDRDWTQLWWVRIDGRGRLVGSVAERQLAIERLIAKYPQYQVVPITGPVIALEDLTWRGWP